MYFLGSSIGSWNPPSPKCYLNIKRLCHVQCDRISRVILAVCSIMLHVTIKKLDLCMLFMAGQHALIPPVEQIFHNQLSVLQLGISFLVRGACCSPAAIPLPQIA